MSNVRHVTFSSLISFSSDTAAFTDQNDIRQEIGIVYMPQNKIYSIQNLNITNMNRIDLSGYPFTINNFHHRFFLSNNPYDEIVPQLSGFTLTVPTDNIFTSNDIKDSSNTGFLYNPFYVRSPSGVSSIDLRTVKTQTIFESYPIVDSKSSFYNNFYFNSTSNNYLCFCFFPQATAPIGTSQKYRTQYNYSINFDLIQE